MTKEISNSDDYIDSRDVIARIDELQDSRSDCPNAHDKAIWETSDEGVELCVLLALQDDAEGYALDWKYGATLVRDSYFKDHAMELADDIGAIDANQTWPLNCIDWEQAARELRMDYTSVDFDGVTYWVR